MSYPKTISHSVNYDLILGRDVLKKLILYFLCAALSLTVVYFSYKTISESDKSYLPVFSNISGGPVLILDPGHGGEDGGAVSNGGVVESVINLDIAVKLRDICALFGVSPVMTRESEEIDYPDDAGSISQKKTADQKGRVALINSYDYAVLISIHQNKFPSSSPFGAQVLFNDKGDSSDFATSLQTQLIEKIDPSNYRTAAKIQDTIYLMKNINCPGVLVECGFLSNPNEEALLQTDAYRLKLAMVIASSYFDHYVLNDNVV